MNIKEKIINVLTGEETITERDMNAEELAQYEADQIANAAQQETEAQKASEEAARLSAKLAIYAKL